MEAGGSVVYRMAHEERVPLQTVLEAAMHHAASARLPLAVVYGLDLSEDPLYDIGILDELILAEQELAIHGIPLMVLVGDIEARFGWFCEYTRPVRIWTREDVDTVTEPSTPVPVLAWPGTVIPVSDIQDLVRSGTFSCGD